MRYEEVIVDSATEKKMREDGKLIFNKLPMLEIDSFTLCESKWVEASPKNGTAPGLCLCVPHQLHSDAMDPQHLFIGAAILEHLAVKADECTFFWLGSGGREGCSRAR